MRHSHRAGRGREADESGSCPGATADVRQPMLRTLAIGAAGGAVFSYVDLPLAWMLGAMVATTATSLRGVALTVDKRLRTVMIVILGVMVGSSFTPQVVDSAGDWWPTLGGLAAYLATVLALLYFYFTRVLKLDPVTAYFSATPGGLTEMVIVGAAHGGDDRTIALMHACRVLLVVLVIPIWFRISTGVVADPAIGAPSLGLIAFDDGVVLLACGVIGVLAGRVVRLPGYVLVGPMLASAAVHASGISSSAPPYQLVAAAQVVMGSAIGARFTGVAVDRMLRALGASVVSTAVMLAVALAFVQILSRSTGTGWAAMVLAYAPGGLPEMTLIALTLGVETAFVATHHVVRIGLIVIGAPLVFALVRRFDATASPRSSD